MKTSADRYPNVESSRMSVRAMNAIERFLGDNPKVGIDPKKAGLVGPHTLGRALRFVAKAQNRTVFTMLKASVKNCGKLTALEIMKFAGELPHQCVCKTCGRALGDAP